MKTLINVRKWLVDSYDEEKKKQAIAWMNANYNSVYDYLDYIKKNPDCLFRDFDPKMADTWSVFFRQVRNNFSHDVRLTWSTKRELVETSDEDSIKKVNLFRWLVNEGGPELMRDFARMAVKVREYKKKDSLEDLIKSEEVRPGIIINWCYQQWLSLPNNDISETTYDYLTIGAKFQNYCEMNYVSEVYWQVDEHFPARYNKTIENKNEGKEMRKTTETEKIVKAVGKRYYTQNYTNGTTPKTDKKVLRDIVVNILVDGMDGFDIFSMVDIRIQHWLQKDLKNLEIPELLDFIAAIKHHSAKHDWLTDEVKELYQTWLQYGPRNTTIFESNNIKIEFDAKKRKLKLRHKNQVNGMRYTWKFDRTYLITKEN
jgi:hypothetical protein